MKLADLKKPQFHRINSQRFLYIPVFDEDKSFGPDYVIDFPITKKGPSRKGIVVYWAAGLGEISPGAMFHAWRQAYAVCKNAAARVPSVPQGVV